MVIGIKMKMLINYMKTALDNDLKKYNLTSNQLLVLEYLNENEDKQINLKDICEFLNIKPPTVSQIIKRLSEKNLISKSIQRKSFIYITSSGKRKYESVGDKINRVEKLLLDGFNNDERQMFEKQLDKMFQNIAKYLESR